MLHRVIPIRFIPKINSIELLERHCEGYFRNIWFTSSRFGEVAADYEEVWSFPGPERSWRFQHHSLVSVSHLCDGYEELGELKYLQKAEELIINWHEVNYPESPSDMGWHDHSTAYRLANICRFFFIWKAGPLHDEKKEKALVKIAAVHAETLMEDGFYMPNHNHGLEQDMALYTASVTFSEMEESSSWREKSLERFWNQVNYLFAEDGSFFEHSPQYVYSLLKTLFKFLSYLKVTGYEESAILEERLHSAFRFLVYISRPDWKIPSIGDSENAKVSRHVMQGWSDQARMLMEDLGTKEEGRKPSLPVDSVFFHGGFAALRNKWAWDDEAVQLIAYSGFHSRVHKHHDDLSFVLFARGRELLTEGGKYSYNYQSMERQYVVSPPAHNSVMADGQAAGIPNLNRGKSGLLSAVLTKNIAYVSGMHALYKNINHRRFFLYLKPDIVLVFDRLKGYKDHVFETHFNFHSELECRNENDRFIGSLEGEETIGIRQLFSSTGAFEAGTASGETSPLKGWISPDFGKMVPNTLLTFKTEGLAADNVYEISLGPSLKNREAPEVKWDGEEIFVSWKNYQIELRLTDFYEHLFINDKYYRSKKHLNTRLIEAATDHEAEHVQAARRTREGAPV
ncbi:heparinase II/III family protein [Bacillus infantis]|jgi:Heparinase II/III-like protein/Heparinase II/III N-terminus|uniref:heparinase II/III family protein n=1 Tax=Bacillus infantis TaxID=324767 RepID=UPI002155D22D|nr:heparinase II/III family protein [Bacillus infantis]MCR6612875.1 heparinase II/III family protein [Bacillus infantis]